MDVVYNTSSDSHNRVVVQVYRCDGSHHVANTDPVRQGDYLSMFENWKTNLLTKLSQTLPNLNEEISFKSSCHAIIDADKVRISAVQKRDEISKQVPVDQDALDKANKTVAEAEEQLRARIDESEELAKNILSHPNLRAILSDDFDDNDLVTYVILSEATPGKLAQWCDSSPDHAKELLEFLHNIDLMKDFVQAGGARKGEYPKAVQIYNQINPSTSNQVIYRLALAIALELSFPCPHFDTPDLCVDPIQRFIHFEQAYLLGELDPSFCRFNVWELRHIVNCDATEEELGWGRQSLLNYRPDIAYSNDPQWRYCWIVRSDVSYNDPVWYKLPHSYDQILSGGGECGPRAWYGRFICKLFGIPTWGLVQPGHAAFARWTVNGWCTCLGAGFEYSSWEDECGLNFQLTTQAMHACESEVEFANKVRRLEWIALLNNEDATSVRGHFLPHPDSLWWSLSYFQRRIIVSGNRRGTVFMHPDRNSNQNFLQRIYDKNQVYDQIQKCEESTSLVIPASWCSKPKTTTSNVVFMKCFSGGQQLFLTANGTVEYNLKSPIVTKKQAGYIITCCLCTVHRVAKPLQLVVSIDGKDDEPITIDLPYTHGTWGETTPAAITLGGPDVQEIVLRFIRADDIFGFSLKYITLKAI